MTVYVDDAFIPAVVGSIDDEWCHMAADDDEELHAFALKIGLQRRWAQDEHGFLHYDLTKSRRRRAIAAGAKMITVVELVERFMGKAKERRQEAKDVPWI